MRRVFVFEHEDKLEPLWLQVQCCHDKAVPSGALDRIATLLLDASSVRSRYYAPTVELERTTTDVLGKYELLTPVEN